MATVILQARVGSTRLPGKALKVIRSKPMLYYTVETLKKSPAVDRIVLAIPNGLKDDPLVAFAQSNKIDCFRGSEDNVLERFYRTALVFKDDYYFRATGDNPIVDYNNPKRLLDHLVKNNCDYTWERGMPIGSVVEAFTFKALEKSYKEAVSSPDKEHVTLYMKNSGKFKNEFVEAPPALYHKNLRLTVDLPEDFDRATEIIETVYKDEIPPFEKVIKFAKKKNWI